ncbi:MAG TPA: inositol monophosphatase family protein [Candidatus Acidoferrales bacterium]|nr:inositol monophosphatase family protein [Candidatus Acidoferrales bacterium]
MMNLVAAQKAAIAAAHAAGKIMRDNWHAPKRVHVIDLHDIKLELDVRCQKTIEKILGKAFPEIPLLGEEGTSGDLNAEYRWVVDPIDGTVNYYFGMPHAAVSIALQATAPGSSLALFGVIYDPFTDELWTATHGGKTRLNGKVVQVSRRAKLNDAVIAMGFSKSRENMEKSLPHLNRLARQAKKIRIMGSAALELAYVASGRLDAYIERTINIWDIAAGGLMVQCSGGEMFLKKLPDGRLRMCADNGLLRKKLKINGLLK